MCNSELPDLTAVLDKEFGKIRLKEISHRFQKTLTQLWLTCDMLMLPVLQNHAMKKLRSVLRYSTVDVETTALAFESVSSESPLRRALLQQVSRDFLKQESEYTAQDIDAFKMIAGFWPALFGSLKVCGEAFRDCHEHVGIIVELEPDQEFYVPTEQAQNDGG
jgi:hypothetical protein